MISGQITSEHIGLTVYLSNSAIQCQKWTIADVNHDGTSGTVDLFSSTTLNGVGGEVYFNDTLNNIYKNSLLDTYLESTVYNGFATEVKNALNNMNVVSNGETIQRHVVAPSMTEIGGYGTEGNEYSSYAYLYNKSGWYPYPDGGYGADYWTRTAGYGTRGVCFYRFNDRFDSDGSACYLSASVIARIRFAKA